MKKDLQSLSEINAALVKMTAQDIVRWSYARFGNGLALTSSFGADSPVMLHMTTVAVGAGNIPVLFSDTGYHYPETLEYSKAMTELLSLDVHIIRPGQTTESFERQYGRLWESDPKKYNLLRKILPLAEAQEDLSIRAILSGVRHDQTEDRKNMDTIEFRNGVFHIHPILGWNRKMVDSYIVLNELPRNPLVAQGITSIGDMHTSGKDRKERFRGDDRMECGLHLRDGAAFEI